MNAMSCPKLPQTHRPCIALQGFDCGSFLLPCFMGAVILIIFV